MPVEELAAGLFHLLGRFLGYFLLEIVFEILIKGPGYLIVKYLLGGNKDERDPDGILVLFMGIAFWLAIVLLGYLVYTYIIQ